MKLITAENKENNYYLIVKPKKKTMNLLLIRQIINSRFAILRILKIAHHVQIYRGAADKNSYFLLKRVRSITVPFGIFNNN
jgi:hypothetical protein